MIADGSTEIRRKDGSYPTPSCAKEISDIVCQKTLKFLGESLNKKILMLNIFVNRL